MHLVSRYISGHVFASGYVSGHVPGYHVHPHTYLDATCPDRYLDTCQDNIFVSGYPRNALIRIQIYIWKHIRTSDMYLDISRILIWLPRHVSGHVSGHLTSVWHRLGSSWIARLNQTLNDITHIRILNFAVLSYELGRSTHFCGLETLRDFC